jgi:hypothetical protein
MGAAMSRVAQFCFASSLAVLLLNGCSNVGAQQVVIGDDQAPKEWDTTEDSYGINTSPPPPKTFQLHHVECTNKSRFKMQSEDGKWHCLKLTP